MDDKRKIEDIPYDPAGNLGVKSLSDLDGGSETKAPEQAQEMVSENEPVQPKNHKPKKVAKARNSSAEDSGSLHNLKLSDEAYRKLKFAMESYRFKGGKVSSLSEFIIRLLETSPLSKDII